MKLKLGPTWPPGPSVKAISYRYRFPANVAYCKPTVIH